MFPSREAVLDVSAEEITALLRSGYRIDPDELHVISGEIATVCRVEAGDVTLAVKALPGSPDDGRLVRWQIDGLTRLSRAGLPVPTVRPTYDGAVVYEAGIAGMTVFTVVTEWLDDPPLAGVDPVDDALLDAIGATAARVGTVLGEMPPPPVPARHEWELTRTAESLRAALPRVRDRHVAAAAGRVAEIHEHSIRPLLSELTHAVVHHDLHDDNLLIGRLADGTRGVTGILDFGDMVVGPRIAECVVAAAYAARNTSDPVAALARVAAGWHRVTPLAPAERRVLLPGAQSRLALNAAVWAARAAGPRADYALSRSTGTMTTLDRLLGTESADFLELLDRACRHQETS